MRIAILGASGNAGRAVARMLRASTAHDLLLLGRDATRLQRAVSEVERAALRGARPTSGSVRHAVVAPADPRQVGPALRGQDLLIVAAPLSGRIGPWARATLEADCDWYDLTLSAPAKWSALRALEPLALDRGRCLVTDGGVHPGLPGTLARFAAARISARRVWVAMRFGIAWSSLEVSTETVDEFAGEIAPVVALLSQWQEARRPGLSCQAMLGDPERLVRDLEGLGVASGLG